MKQREADGLAELVQKRVRRPVGTTIAQRQGCERRTAFPPRHDPHARRQNRIQVHGPEVRRCQRDVRLQHLRGQSGLQRTISATKLCVFISDQTRVECV